MEPIDSPDGLFHDETYPGSEDGTIITALWLNNAQAALIALSGLAGDVVALAAPYTLLASDGVALADTVAGGFTVSLPVYEDVAAVKRFTVKNISALGGRGKGPVRRTARSGRENHNYQRRQ